jgi:membrane fusion protein (multidrug efflux system)
LGGAEKAIDDCQPASAVAAARRRWPARGLLVLLLAILGGCGQGEPAAPAAAVRTSLRLVEALPVRSEVLVAESSHSGTLRARRTARIYAQLAGRVIALPYYEGDRVETAASLVRIDEALLRAELDKRAALSRQSQLDLERLMRLVDRRLVTEEDLARARTELEVARAEERALRTRIAFADIRAPFAGVVSERLVELGDVVSENQHLLTVVDPESLVTEVAVSELVLPHLQVGVGVGVRIDALGSRVYTGHIARIHPTVDPLTRRGVVEVALAPVPEGARAGQFCRVTLRLETGPRRVVPIEAVQRDRDGEYVFVVDGEHSVHRHGVRTGLRLEQGVELLEGPVEGALVVVKGFMGLADGHQVEVVGGAG